MRSLKAPLKDWRRRRLLRRSGIAVESSAPLETAGARSGTWAFRGDLLDERSVVYSVGVGDNVAWDLALIERYGLTVHAFDPTPRAAAWAAGQALPAEFVFHRVGLAAYDGTQRFRVPARASSVNFRPLPADEGGSEPTLELPVKRLVTLASELGHERIDVLKLDVEGGEYALLPDLPRDALAPRQLLIEFHHAPNARSFERTRLAIADLRERGYRLAWTSPRGLEFAFVAPGRPTGAS